MHMFASVQEATEVDSDILNIVLYDFEQERDVQEEVKPSEVNPVLCQSFLEDNEQGHLVNKVVESVLEEIVEVPFSPEDIYKKILGTLSSDFKRSSTSLMAAPQKLARLAVGNVVCSALVNDAILATAQNFFENSSYDFVVGETGKDEFNDDTYVGNKLSVMQGTVDSFNNDIILTKNLTVVPVRTKDALQQWHALFSENKESMTDFEYGQLYQECKNLHLNDQASLYFAAHKKQLFLAALIVMDSDTAYITYRSKVPNTKQSDMEQAALQRCFIMAHGFKKDLVSLVALSQPSQEKVFASLGLIKNQEWTRYTKK